MVLLLGVVIIADAIEPSKYLNRYKRLEIHRHGQKPTVLHIGCSNPRPRRHFRGSGTGIPWDRGSPTFENLLSKGW